MWVFRVDTYVRVSGKMNSFNNRITFMAHQIRPITDFNEISYHFLETIRSHLAFTRPNKSSAFVSLTTLRNNRDTHIFSYLIL